MTVNDMIKALDEWGRERGVIEQTVSGILVIDNDLIDFLCGDVIVKVDRSKMGVIVTAYQAARLDPNKL